MLCLHLSGNHTPSILNPLWPTSRDVFARLEQDMVRRVEDIKENMKLMDRFHQQLLQEMTIKHNKSLPVLSAGNTTSGDGGFALCLGVKDFLPKELTVKVLGRKLLVTGAKESKCEDGKGSFSYKCQIFRKEADLPDDVRAEELSCIVTTDGQLHVEAPRATQAAGKERTVPIQLPATSEAKKLNAENNASSKP
ncbi:heat shock protein beta-11-like [Spea bombifrons]|uniref:heat shock protein beta-11-like n=1 Tax=Spea bombifrons TaxID=233779 RepID=UPI002349790F|nr:heat shock protein beta-11-like [Spea bombifrons]